MAKTPFDAKKARMATTQAKRRKKAQLAEDGKKAVQTDRALRQNMKELAESPRYIAEYEKEIREASAEGSRSTAIAIAFDEREILPQHRYLASFVKNRLVAKGFTVQESETKEEPCGSDPLYTYTVYHLWLEVSW